MDDPGPQGRSVRRAKCAWSSARAAVGTHAIVVTLGLVTLGEVTLAGLYLRLAAAPLAGLELAEANGEVEAITFGLFCLGFFTSRFPRRCFMDMRFLRTNVL